MKNSIFTFIVILLVTSLSFGNIENSIQERPQVGDTLIVSENSGSHYRHIDFPRLNFIVKRGGISSYKSVHNTRVIVEEVFENKFGKVFVKLKRADGKKFFNRDRYVTANYEKAIEKGELKVTS